MAGTLTLEPAEGDVKPTEEIRLPTLREDLQLLAGPPLADGAPSWNLHDTARNRFFRIGWGEFEMLQRWPMNNPQQIIDSVNRDTPLTVSQDQLMLLIRFLATQQLILAETDEAVSQMVESAQRLRPSPLSFLLHRYLFFRIPLWRPDNFLVDTWPLVAPLFTRGFAWLISLLGLLGLYLVSRQWDSFVSSYLHMQTWNGLLLIGFAVLFSKLVHELGHAYACKKYNIRVPVLGVAFLVMWPVLYTDTSEAWKLNDRKQRLLIGAGGMLAELSLAIIASVLWAVWPEGAARSAFFLLAGTTWLLTLLVNLNPFMRFDGYYLLSDYLDVQNLQDRSFALGRWQLRKFLFGWTAEAPEFFTHKRRQFLIAYAWGTWLYRLFLFIGIALLVYFLFFKLAGILLMTVELAWFIARPLYSEMREWYRQREQFHWNRRLIITSAIMISGLLLLLIPRSHIILLPATVQHSKVQTLYTPIGARIDSIKVVNGQTVNRGDLLIQLVSDDLSRQRELTKLAVKVAEENLLRYSSSAEGLDGQRIARETLAKAISNQTAISERIAQLSLRANMHGQVSNLADHLHIGRWVNSEQPLLKISSSTGITADAYIDSRELAYLDPQSEARFYADDPAFSSFPLHFVQIDPAATTELHRPYLASSYGGPIGVKEDSDKPLAPQNSLYRIHFSAEQPLQAISQVIIGKVHLQSAPYSQIETVWRNIVAVLQRESGF